MIIREIFIMLPLRIYLKADKWDYNEKDLIQAMLALVGIP
jgi:hypothetical protein